MSDSQNGAPRAPLHETPEAGPAQAPTWRDQFAGSASQTPEAEVRIPVSGQPGNGNPTAQNVSSERATPLHPTGAPVEESVLNGGDVTPDAIVRGVRDFIDASPEQRTQQARQAAEKLKPIAADAEKVVARALDLGAKGLAGLAAKLEERNKQRG